MATFNRVPTVEEVGDNVEFEVVSHQGSFGFRRHHKYLGGLLLTCSCQYGPGTPSWYRTVASCPIHQDGFDASQTPSWGWEMYAQDSRREPLGWWEKFWR